VVLSVEPTPGADSTAALTALRVVIAG
jgi:hypothetical protein